MLVAEVIAGLPDPMLNPKVSGVYELIVRLQVVDEISRRLRYRGSCEVVKTMEESDP